MFIIIWKHDLMPIIVWKNIIHMTDIDTMSLSDNKSDEGDSDDRALLVRGAVFQARSYII